VATRRAFVVAVTGGIASGKSAVCTRLAELGVPLIDADVVAREVVQPGQPALDEIRTAFGATMIAADGSLDRARMRQHVFAQPAERARLEAILHPRIRARMREQAAAVDAPYCVLAIPLLVESGTAYDWVDRVVVVDATPEAQVQRLIQRDRIDAKLAHDMVAAQVSRAARLAIADDVVVNDGTLEQLRERTDELHDRLLMLARRAWPA
jgi:dephospho-CoA kinase